MTYGTPHAIHRDQRRSVEFTWSLPGRGFGAFQTESTHNGGAFGVVTLKRPGTGPSAAGIALWESISLNEHQFHFEWNEAKAAANLRTRGVDLR